MRTGASIFALVLAVSLTSIGCRGQLEGCPGGPSTGALQPTSVSKRLYVDPTFGARGQLVEEAAREWEVATSGIVAFPWTNDWHDEPGTFVVVAAPSSQAALSTYYDKRSGATLDLLGLTFTWDGDASVFIAEDESDVHLTRTAAHELGHALGLGHSKDPDDLMYVNVAPVPYGPSCDDVVALCDLVGCDASKTNACTCP